MKVRWRRKFASYDANFYVDDSFFRMKCRSFLMIFSLLATKGREFLMSLCRKSFRKCSEINNIFRTMTWTERTFAQKAYKFSQKFKKKPCQSFAAVMLCKWPENFFNQSNYL